MLTENKGKAILHAARDWRIVILIVVGLLLGWVSYMGEWVGLSPLIFVTLVFSLLLPFVGACSLLLLLISLLKKGSKNLFMPIALAIFASSVLIGRFSVDIVDNQMNDRAAQLVIEAADLYEKRNGHRPTSADKLVPEYLAELPQAWLGLLGRGKMQLNSDGTCAVRNADWYICYHCRKAEGSGLEVGCID